MSYAEPINPDGKEIRVAVRLRKEMKERFIAYCQKRNMAGSAVLRELIKDALDRDEARSK